MNAAAYLAGRLQVSEKEMAHVPGHEGRKADMSPAAGAAMRAVLAEMSKEGGDAADAAAGVIRLTPPVSPCSRTPPERSPYPIPPQPLDSSPMSHANTPHTPLASDHKHTPN